jgi:hypothetical protein
MWAVWFISMDRRLYIALLEFRLDDGVSASLFGGFLYYFVVRKHNKQKMNSFEQTIRCAEVRRQGYDRKIVST